MQSKYLFVSVLLLIFCVGAYGIEMSASVLTAEKGAVVTAGISVDKTVGIAGGDITLEYDATIVTVKDVRVTDLAKPLSPLSNPNTAGKIKFAMAAVTALKAGSGELFQIDFEIKADKGLSPLTLKDVGLFDELGNDLPVIVKSGSITVKEKQATPPKALTIATAKGFVGDNIATTISIDDLSVVAGGDLVLKYDPKIVSLVEAKATALLNGVSVVINSGTAGKISIAMASPKGLVSGKGAIIDFTFKGLAVGVSDFAFDSASLFDETGKDLVSTTVNAKITVDKKPCTNPIIKEHAASSKILALQATYNEADVHGHAYVDIWKGEFTIAVGQFIEYQEVMFSGNPVFSGSVDLLTADKKTLRDSVAKDQNGISAHPSADLSKFARDSWYHRKISLDALAGQKVVGAVIATDSDKHRAGLFRVYVDNIQITDGDCVLLNIYKDEDNVPITNKPVSSDTTFVGAAGTKDFSVSVVGQTPVEPAGKLASTWGSIKQ
jgi:hypothetical protein